MSGLAVIDFSCPGLPVPQSLFGFLPRRRGVQNKPRGGFEIKQPGMPPKPMATGKIPLAQKTHHHRTACWCKNAPNSFGALLPLSLLCL